MPLLTLNDIPLATTGIVCNEPNPPAVCNEGSATQDAAATCSAVALGNCQYPRETLNSCAVLGGAPATCAPNGGGDPELTITDTDWHGPLNFTYTTDNGTATVTGVSISPVTDGSTVSHVGTNDCANPLKDGTATICTEEDTAVNFTITVDSADDSVGDVAETVNRVRVTGLQPGATVTSPFATSTASCGTNCVDITNGAAGLPLNTPISVTYTPPPNWASVTTGNGSDVVGFRAQMADDGAAPLDGTLLQVRIEVQEIADLPIVNIPNPSVIIGVEDNSVQISGTAGTFTAALQDLDGSEQLTLLISGVPGNATLAPGIDQGGGVWSVSPAQLAAGVFFSFNGDPDHLDTNPTLTLTATASENYSFAVAPGNPLDESQAVVARNISLEMNAVADPPSLMIGTASETTNEDTSVQLDFSGMLADTDGSETLTFLITNLPLGSSLSAGTPAGAGAYSVTAAQALAGVSFVPAEHDDYGNTDVTLDVAAVAMEGVGVCTISSRDCNVNIVDSCGLGNGACLPPTASSATQQIDIEVVAVADAPTLAVPGNFTGISEGADVSIDALIADLVDDDGSESCEVVITWDATDFVEPEMVGPVTFNRGGGATISGEIWSMPCSDTGTGLDLQLPSNGHTDVNGIEFCVTATTMEARDGQPTASTGPQCFTVRINSTNQVCNDGHNDVSEDCDDGQYNDNAPNACRTDCTNPVCGDGIFDDGSPWDEECDAGGGNSDIQPDTCRSDCRLPYCGDNVEDMFEACDDGNNGIQTDACLDGCLAASCGDGFTWAGNEECDNGLMNSDTLPDACRTTCVAAGCTDGVLDTGEACDDGNANDGDACPGSCQDATCGDGFTFIGMEECDQGANNSDIQPDTCRSTCDLPGCGDTVVDTGEECDDGNTVNEDICVNSCDLNFCGDGFVDLGNEECDEGTDNSNSDPDTCRPDCSNPFCGDGVVDSGESCDLGVNNDDNDPNGCKTNCALPGCGDGVVGAGEQCDDGANNSNTVPDACRVTCTLARCGDGVMDTGEVCDDGPANSNQVPNACRTTCMLSGCGDGVVDANETCDDGANNSDTTPGACRTSCVVPSCGDSVVDPGEACDDGANNSDTASGACRTTCVLADCGDGVVDPGEACDDGAANGTDPDGCETDCTLPPECGDGFVDAGEECDDGALNSDADADACRTDCTNAICGDGVVDSGEECDAGATASDTCDSDCAIIEEGGDMGMGGDDMGMNNANNTTPDMGDNNSMNNGTGDDMGDTEDMGGDNNNNTGNNGTGTPAAEDGCCRTIRRAEGDNGVAGWLAMVALGLIALRRRR